MRVRRCSLNVDLQLLLSKGKWWLALVVPVFASGIVTINLPAFPGSRFGPNQWDFFLMVFNSPFYVALWFPIAFVFVIADLTTQPMDTGMVHYMVVRYVNRTSWWFSKMIAIILAAWIYVLTAWGIATIFSLVVVPWNASWSAMAQKTQFHFSGGLSTLQLHHAPLGIMFLMIALLGCGFSALGVVCLALATITRHAMAGLALGVMMVFLSYGAWMTGVGGQGAAWRWFPLLQGVIGIHTHFFPLASPRIHIVGMAWSFSYDGIVIVLGFLAGYVTTRVRNW